MSSLVHTRASYREVSHWNFGLENVYSDYIISVVFSVHTGKLHDSALNYSTTASFHVLSNSSFIYHPFIRRYIIWVTEKSYLNKLKMEDEENKNRKEEEKEVGYISGP
jgi:hypothetical protein